MPATSLIQSLLKFLSNIKYTTAMATDSVNGVITTRTLPVETKDLGHFLTKPVGKSLDVWSLSETSSMSFKALRDAARLLRTSNTPVAFPTETVYGLGGDATRSDAVKGI